MSKHAGGKPKSNDAILADYLGLSRRQVVRMGGYDQLAKMTPAARNVMLRATKRKTLPKCDSIAVVKRRKGPTVVWWKCSIPGCQAVTSRELCKEHIALQEAGEAQWQKKNRRVG